MYMGLVDNGFGVGWFDGNGFDGCVFCWNGFYLTGFGCGLECVWLE